MASPSASPPLPAIRSLEGLPLSAEAFNLPVWALPYFRAGGTYTYWPVPSPDASGGRTRTADTPAPHNLPKKQQQKETADADAKRQEAGTGRDPSSVSSLQHASGSSSSTSVASTTEGEAESPAAAAAVYRHLLYDVLTQPGGVEKLLFFVSECKCHVVALCTAGGLLCGHKGVVHGGFTATLLDNAMGGLAHWHYKRAATKTLNISYLRPFIAGSTVLFDAYVAEINARACKINGTLIGPAPPALAKSFPPQQQQQQQQQQSKGLECLPPRAEGLWRGTINTEARCLHIKGLLRPPMGTLEGAPAGLLPGGAPGGPAASP
ncbi:hypothetical protein Efla_005388 [Eimeria flavescens]